MKVILMGSAQSKPEAIGLLTEDMLLNPSLAEVSLSKMNLTIDHVEMQNGQKVVYIKENKSNLLLG